MPQVKYLPIYDELEIIFKESQATSLHTASNGVILEFDGDELAYIIAPHFSQSIHIRPANDAIFTYEGSEISDDILTVTIKMNQQKINIKIDIL